MKAQLDPHVKAVFDEIVARTPDIGPTPLGGVVHLGPAPSNNGRGWLAVAAAAIVVVAVGGLLAIERPSSDTQNVAPAAQPSAVSPLTEQADTTRSESLPAATGETTVASPSPVTVPANNAVVEPTLLTSSGLPTGLTLEDGGTVTSAGPAEVELITPDNSVSYRIQWQPADCNSAGVPPRTDALADLATQQVSAGEHPIDPSVQWCDGPNVVAVYSTGSTPDGFVAFVSTVSAAADSSSVTFIPPSGMQYRSGLVTRTWSALSYRNGDRVILIKVTSAVDGEIPLSLAQVSDEQAIIVGRFTAYRMADQPSPQLLLVYDDNTVVFISGENVTDQELEDAAAALRPADPTLAPPVSGNCKTFGAMCG